MLQWQQNVTVLNNKLEGLHINLNVPASNLIQTVETIILSRVDYALCNDVQGVIKD